MRKAPAGLLAQVPAEHGCSAAEVIISAGMFMASGRLTLDPERIQGGRIMSSLPTNRSATEQPPNDEG